MVGYQHFDASIALGTLGLLTTTFYTFLPSLLFIFIGAPIIEKTQENKKVKEVLTLVTAGVVGVILNLTIYLGKAVLMPKVNEVQTIGVFSIVWVVISLIALYHWKWNMIKWIGVSALFGLGRYLFY